MDHFFEINIFDQVKRTLMPNTNFAIVTAMYSCLACSVNGNSRDNCPSPGCFDGLPSSTSTEPLLFEQVIQCIFILSACHCHTSCNGLSKHCSLRLLRSTCKFHIVSSHVNLKQARTDPSRRPILKFQKTKFLKQANDTIV